MSKTVLLLASMAVALVLVSGVALAATTIECTVGTTCLGTSGDDEITGTTEADRIKARAGNDTAYGLGGRDKIFGQDGIDSLYGGARNDTLNGGSGDIDYDNLCGGAGNDTLVESAGYDRYMFPENWGRDVISSPSPEDGSRPDLVTFNAGCPEFSPVSADLTINFATGEAFETDAGQFSLSPNTVSLAPGAIEILYSGSGNDTITGDGGYNNVHTGNGNDTIDVSGDAGVGDFLDCGAGIDTVTKDADDNTATFNNCETVTVP